MGPVSGFSFLADRTIPLVMRGPNTNQPAASQMIRDTGSQPKMNIVIEAQRMAHTVPITSEAQIRCVGNHRLRQP